MTARSRDRRVYLGSHPALFALLAASRRWPVLRLGGTLLVHDREAFTAALTEIPLDRTGAGTTGGAAARLTGGDLLFDQQGAAHRRARREVAESLGAAGVARLRPIWTDLLDRRLKPLADGGQVDLVPLAAELAGATTAALLGLEVDGRDLAAAARAAGAAAARSHLPGPRRRRAERAAQEATDRLSALLTPGGGAGTGKAAGGLGGGVGTGQAAGEAAGGLSAPGGGAGTGQAAGEAAGGLSAPGGGAGAGRAAMLAVAAINTTVAALPRAAAWASDADLWGYADSPALVDELLRVTAPSPLLPRRAAASGSLPVRRGSCPVRAGDRLLLIARTAVAAAHRDPDPTAPAPARVAQLVFGAGPHACPGARLARAQLADLLLALAPLRPVVVRARVDRHAALPGWRSLIVRASTAPAPLGRGLSR